MERGALIRSNRADFTFADIGSKIGRDEVWVAAVFYGQAKPLPEDIRKLESALKFDAGVRFLSASGLAFLLLGLTDSRVNRRTGLGQGPGRTLLV